MPLPSWLRPGGAGRSEAWERFMASTAIDYEKWHDGVGYDLEALASLQYGERVEAERWLLARAGKDWRDLDGLLTLGTEAARAAVANQLRRGRLELRLAAARRLADDPVLAPDREAAVIDGLLHAEFGSGLSDALHLAVEEATPPVIDALVRGMRRTGTAVHAAAALERIHGVTAEEFDWERRPLYLRLVAEDAAERRAAFETICRGCGIDPARYPG